MALTKVSGDFIQDGSITQGHLHASHGITTSDIGEGNNLYFTTARVNTAVGNLSTSDLSEGTNLYYTQARFDTAFAAKSTSNLSEGTNLYYTDARVGSYLTTNSYATSSSTHTFTNKSGNISQWTNDSGYITDGNTNWDNSYGFITASSTETLTNKSGNISMFTNDSGYITDGNTNWDNSYGFITASSTDTLTNKSGNISQWTNDSGYITGVTNISGYSEQLLREDNRTISPSELTAGRLKFGFTSWANNNSSPYADFLHMRSYTDSSGGSDNLVMFKKSGLGMRLWQQGYGSSTAYSSYVDMIDTGSNNQVKSGYIQSNASLRAPIFYDSNNTGYYIDPASDSVLARADINGGANYPLQVSSSQRYMIQARNTGNTVNSGYGWWWFTDTNFNMGFHADGAADRLTLTRDGDLIIGQTSISYTSNDNTPIVGSNTTNRLHVNGSIQLTNNNDALVIGRGTASFFKDEEIGFGWGGGWYMIDGTYLRVRNNVAVYSTGYIYAGLYYDSDDTNYYLNPSSNSQFSGGLAIGTTSWDTTNLKLDVNGRVSLREGFYMGVSTNNYNSWQGRIYNSGSGQYWSGQSWYFNGSGWGGGNYWTLDNSGNSVASGSHRAPIFYDSGNTTYYVDPASGTSINVAGTGTFVSNSSTARVLYLDAGSSNGNIIQFIRSGTNKWELVGRDGTFYIYKNDGSGSGYRWQIDTNGNHTITGNATFATDVRSQIFYDSNDTAFYVDPNGTSNIYKIQSGSKQAAPRYDTAFYVLQAQHWYGDNGSQTMFLGEAGNAIYVRGSMYSPIYYDYNNTNYFYHGDASASLAGTMNIWGGTSGNYGNQLIIGQQSISTAYTLQDTNQRPVVYMTGAYPVLALNHTATTNTVHGPTLQFTFNGSNARQWVFGASGDGEHLDIGYSASGLGNTNYNPHHGIGGYTGTTFMTFKSNGNIGIGSAGDWGYFGGGDPGYAIDTRGTLYNNTDVRSLIFYDSNSTGYYLDPGATGTSLNVAGKINASNFNGTNFKYLGTGVSYDTNRDTKVADGIALYGAYSGGSNSPHTYDFSAQFVGSSRGFELSAAWWTQPALYIRTLRDCCTNWSSWYAIAIHGLNLGSSALGLYAGAFYDSANTGYYVDPASGTILNGNQLNYSCRFRASTSGSFNFGTGYGFHAFENGISNEPIAVFYNQVNTTSVQHYGINILSAADHNNTTSRFMAGQGGATERIKIYSNGNIQNSNNSYGQLSDINLKENIVDATPKLDELKQIRVVNFNYIGDINEETNIPNKQIGVIAQEVEQIFPGLVYECGDTEVPTKSVKYSVFVPMMLKAIQEQQTIIDDLKARIEILENQ